MPFSNITKKITSGAVIPTPLILSPTIKFGKNLTEYQKDTGFYDVFMICATHGHVMYTAAKEADLGTNLKSGPYKNSGLAEVWKKTVESGCLYGGPSAY